MKKLKLIINTYYVVTNIPISLFFIGHDNSNKESTLVLMVTPCKRSPAKTDTSGTTQDTKTKAKVTKTHLLGLDSDSTDD